MRLNQGFGMEWMYKSNVQPILGLFAQRLNPVDSNFEYLRKMYILYSFNLDLGILIKLVIE